MQRQEDLEIKLEELRLAVESGLSELVRDRGPGELYDSVRYVLSGGGKRLRPLLLLLSADVFEADLQEASPLALAVELAHNFSLVHDDIMDHADTRRGRKTVHVLWDPDTAILCGDVLLALANESVSKASSDKGAQLIQVFSEAIRGLCEGQALDMAIETKQDLKTSDYLQMIDGKTGALLSGSLEMGGIFGGADSHARLALRAAGKSIGRAFQIQDDLLDVVADSQHWGKVQGGDLIEGKRTYLLLKACERATGEDLDFFERIRPGSGLDKREIPKARERMEKLGVFDAARASVRAYTCAALAQIDLLPGDTSRLHALIDRMAARVH
ncbi:MAG: polyprenyl synthetase family protein [Rhodothermaceae bacterium]|nr:polyprenyl synthetase family protein [Rhodothermaceae bacterium]MXX58630.1 polyprenyl synthetase family protein [Rhodothermaceae bacterium]MYD19709.1 polyprenyl synthetase family protein [Rhodothermaceae bacterium]MYD57026.1 polyprenyl synthetase family protein [Rhodothermaceae bacterium]MYI44755.1 polyprenyl synthetase family protein [Rhodothermaceae bacterium]